MSTFEILLEQTGLFIIYMLAGVILIRTKVLNRETLEPISRFVIKMALPLMVFINITDGAGKEVLLQSWPVLVIAAGFYICMFIAGRILIKLFRLESDQIGVYRAMMLFGNIGFMGMPMIVSVFPGDGALYGSVFMMIDQFMLWTLGVKLLASGGKEKFQLRKLVNPATVAIVLAVFMVLTGLRLPALLDTAFQKIGATSSPLAMIYIGGIFATADISKYLKKISLYGIVIVKMILMPVLLFVVLGMFPVSGEMRLIMALLTGMSTMTAVVMMANASGLDGDYAMGGVLVTTMCGIFTLPTVCWILQNMI